MTKLQLSLVRKPCAIKCMVFNETAKEIMSLIVKELGDFPKETISLSEDDYAELHIDGRGDNKIVECKEGWTLT